MIKYMLQPNLSSSLSAMENCPNGMGNSCLLPVYTLARVKPTRIFIFISFQEIKIRFKSASRVQTHRALRAQASRQLGGVSDPKSLRQPRAHHLHQPTPPWQQLHPSKLPKSGDFFPPLQPGSSSPCSQHRHSAGAFPACSCAQGCTHAGSTETFSFAFKAPRKKAGGDGRQFKSSFLVLAPSFPRGCPQPHTPPL